MIKLHFIFCNRVNTKAIISEYNSLSAKVHRHLIKRLVSLQWRLAPAVCFLMLWLLYPLHPEEQSLRHSFLTEGRAEKKDEIKKGIRGKRISNKATKLKSFKSPQRGD